MGRGVDGRRGVMNLARGAVWRAEEERAARGGGGGGAKETRGAGRTPVGDYAAERSTQLFQVVSGFIAIIKT